MKTNCPDCKRGSCGNDEHTRTSYRREVNLGNRLKVCLLQITDAIFIDNLQVSEIKCLLNNLIDEHIHETDVGKE